MRISELERKTYSKADYQPIRRCLNCGRDIPDNNATDIYSRRFCSERCKTDYMGAGS
jgi:endogenous inhibitor of DNA gyrase (YacG/DUF329 family)